MLCGNVNRDREEISPLDRLIDKRRSIRKYKEDMAPPEWIREMLRCAGRAPSPSNSQPVRFIGIESSQKKDALARAMALGRDEFLETLKAKGGSKRVRNWINAYYRFSEFLFTAPMVFAVGTAAPSGGFSGKLIEAGLVDGYERKTTESDISVGLALKGFILKGEELGLGSCILTAPLVFVPHIEEILGIEDICIKCLITVGFSDEEPRFIERKGLAEIYRAI